MNLYRSIQLVAATLAVLNSSGQSTQNSPIIGSWRGVFDIRPGVEVPFNFEINTNKTSLLSVYFHNAEEKFEGGKVVRTGDSVHFYLDQFDREMALRISNDSLTGILKRVDGTGSPIAIRAKHGQTFRFAPFEQKADADFSGTYDVTFKNEKGEDEKAVGLFTQKGSDLRATFLRITGDSRYLQGTVEGNRFHLSSFIGSGVSYYTGEFTADGKLTGKIIGPNYQQLFEGVANESAALPDADKLTYLKDGYKTFDFSFPDTKGHLITPKNTKYKNKVLIVTITGTWCPNCIDEAQFLSPWYLKNKHRGVEVVSIHYERKDDPVYVKSALDRYRQKFRIAYDQAFAGIADKQVVATSLPSLNTFLSFPTMIILDKKGNVARIHTGYSGPATGKYYDDFVKDFNTQIDKLVAE